MTDCRKCKRIDVKCCHTCKRSGSNCGVWHKCGEDCVGYEARIVTNADRIRNMTDEELAEWLHNITQFYEDDDVEQLDPMVSIYDLDKKKDIEVRDSYGDLLEWLQKEVE